MRVRKQLLRRRTRQLPSRHRRRLPSRYSANRERWRLPRSQSPRENVAYTRQYVGLIEPFQIQSCADGTDYADCPDRRKRADGLVSAVDIGRNRRYGDAGDTRGRTCRGGVARTSDGTSDGAGGWRVPATARPAADGGGIFSAA